MKKVYITPSPNYLGRTTSPSNYKTGFSTPELSKTGQIAAQAILDGGFVFFFFYLFQRNLCKIIVNHRKIIK
jgi:hypothetical protein